MIHGGYNVEFELAVARGLEHSRVDFDLFNAWAVEFAKGGDYAGFFAGAGRAVDEEVGEVTALCLVVGVFVSRGVPFKMGVREGLLRGSGGGQRGRGGRSVCRGCGGGACLRGVPLWWWCMCFCFILFDLILEVQQEDAPGVGLARRVKWYEG